MKKLTKSDISELKYAAEQASTEWIGKLTGGGIDIAFFEGGHRIVRNDDINCYPVAKYISVADPETILALLVRIKELEKAVLDGLAENSQLLDMYDATAPRPKRKDFEDIELKDEDMW